MYNYFNRSSIILKETTGILYYCWGILKLILFYINVPMNGLCYHREKISKKMYVIRTLNKKKYSNLFKIKISIYNYKNAKDVK